MMRRRAALALAVAAASCGDDSGFPDARVDGPPARGTISLSWTISDGDRVLTCDDVGSTTVGIAIIPDMQPFGSNDILSCTSGQGTSRPIDPGKYDFVITLVGRAGTLASKSIDDKDVASGQDTPLGAIAFEVDATGGLKFRIGTGTAANCTPAGAGMTATTLELRDPAGTCVPATFAIAAGASAPAATYASTCAGAAPVGPCIEADQDVTATGLASGRHQLVLEGRIGAAPCWKRNASIRIPAGGAELAAGTVAMVYDDAQAGCPPRP